MRFLVACVALLALGCSKAPDITGTWNSGLGGALTTYHFKSDGKFWLDALYDGYNAHAEGAYHIEGDKLFLDPSSSSVQGSGPRTEEIRSQLAQPSRVTIKFQGPATFRLGLEDPPLMVHKVAPQP
jgi:hypothetical protein